MATGKFKTVDHKLPRLIQIAQEHLVLQKKPFVKLGYPADVPSTSEAKRANKKAQFSSLTTQLIDVVIWMEFGTETVPERSFIRSTHDKIQKMMRDFTTDLVGKIYDGTMTVERALDLIALKVINETKKSIREGIPPELKDATIRRKGSSKPLIDTGQLLNGMGFKRIMK